MAYPRSLLRGVRTLSKETAIIVLIMALGVFGRNAIVTVAALCTLVLMLPVLNLSLPLLADHGIRVGILLLMLAVLAELASGRVDTGNILRDLTSVDGILAVLGGALASWMSGRGVELLHLRPQIAIGLVVGSVLGASFLGGVPIGPIFAAGLTAIGLGVWQMFVH